MRTNNIAFLVLLLFSRCESPSGHPGVSDDINDSKKRDVFIKEYRTIKNPYVINDTLQLYVKEAWLEKKWFNGNKREQTIIINDNDSYQLCINSTKESLSKYNAIDWIIGLDFHNSLRLSSNSSLISDFKYFPKDTIQLIVYKGDNLDDLDSSKTILAKFILIAKN
jgi:hypothetical protein